MHIPDLTPDSGNSSAQVARRKSANSAQRQGLIVRVSARCLKSATKKNPDRRFVAQSLIFAVRAKDISSRSSGCIEVLQRPTNSEACIMTEKLSVDKALEKLRGSNAPKSRMTLL